MLRTFLSHASSSARRLFYAAGAATALLACQPNDTRQTDGTDLPPATRTPPAVVLSGPASRQWKAVFDAYLSVKDGFVQSDTAAVNRAATALQQAVAAVTPADTAAQRRWPPLQSLLDRTAGTVRGVPALESKRAAFEDLSKIMLEGVAAFGAPGPVYKQYCPMALNDKGAYWLSAESEIRNPYFGDQMLECGEVQQVLEF